MSRTSAAAALMIEPDEIESSGAMVDRHAETESDLSRLPELSDQELLAGLRAQSEPHFGELYNRYFNVKFVSLQGDYNTCSQTCPIRKQVMSDMQAELHDKELGLLRASNDASSFYRADTLLKETDLVLEATCRACLAGESR